VQNFREVGFWCLGSLVPFILVGVGGGGGVREVIKCHNLIC